jgi:hypothetical protein
MKDGKNGRRSINDFEAESHIDQDAAQGVHRCQNRLPPQILAGLRAHRLGTDDLELAFNLLAQCPANELATTPHIVHILRGLLQLDQNGVALPAARQRLDLAVRQLTLAEQSSDTFDIGLGLELHIHNRAALKVDPIAERPLRNQGNETDADQNRRYGKKELTLT